MSAVYKRALAGSLAVVLASGVAMMPVRADNTDSTGDSSIVDNEKPENDSPVNVDLGSETIKIKEGSSGNLANLIAKEFKDEYDIPSGYVVKASGDSLTSKAGSSGMTSIIYKLESKDTYTLNVEWEIVSPDDFKLANEISDIKAIDPNNADANRLLSYVNSDLTLIPMGSEYSRALGDGQIYQAKKFTWENCESEYDPYGGLEYIFSSEYNDSVLVRKFYVRAVEFPDPDIYIDYDHNRVYGTDEYMSYSLDREKWSKCAKDMTIPSNWYDNMVYFKYLGTNNTKESSTDSVYIPIKAEPPTAKMSTISTSHSITITNCWDFDNVEFSINGSDYISTSNETYTFKGLKPNTSYKIYARTAADRGEQLASDPRTFQAKTNEKVETNIDIKYYEKKNSAEIKAIGAVSSDISGSTISGNYNAAIMAQFKSAVTSMTNKYDEVNVDLSIEHYKEANETMDLDKFKFTLPIAPMSEAIKDCNFKLSYNCDIGTIEFYNSDLYKVSRNASYNNIAIEFTEVDSLLNNNNLKWIKQQLDKGRPVYDISVKAGSSELDYTLIIPYELKNGETIPGVSVFGVDSKGNKKDLMAEYDFMSKCFKLSTDFKGYLVIVRDTNDPEVMPFNDVSIDHWAYSSVKYCYNRGIFAGTSASTFGPNDQINRAMIFTLLSKLDTADEDYSKVKMSFNDVKESDWFYKPALWACKNKLASGKTFDPNGYMSRGDITELLYDLMIKIGVPKVNSKYTAKNIAELYTDMDKTSTTVKEAVIFMHEHDIMHGVGDKKFNPDSNVSRAEMSVILYKLNRLVESLDIE